MFGRKRLRRLRRRPSLLKLCGNLTLVRKAHDAADEGYDDPNVEQWRLPSAGVTRLRQYYEPLRHPRARPVPHGRPV